MLLQDEEIVVEMRPHWVFFGAPLIAAVVVVTLVVFALIVKGTDRTWPWSTYPLIAIAAVPSIWFLGRLLRWRNYIIALTTTRIIVRRGVLDRNTLQLRLQRVTEVNTSQVLWERVVGVGRLILDVQGDDDSLVIEDVSKPLVFQRVVNSQIDALVDRHRTDIYPGSARRPDLRPIEPDPDDTPPHGTWVDAGGSYGRDPEPEPDPEPDPEPEPEPEPPSTGPTSKGGATQEQIRDRLIELDDLRQRGILTEEEFSTKKAELLDRI
jgi:membrane protein YdbS with pleckstrin-like domain